MKYIEYIKINKEEIKRDIEETLAFFSILTIIGPIVFVLDNIVILGIIRLATGSFEFLEDGGWTPKTFIIENIYQVRGPFFSLLLTSFICFLFWMILKNLHKFKRYGTI